MILRIFAIYFGLLIFHESSAFAKKNDHPSAKNRAKKKFGISARSELFGGHLTVRGFELSYNFTSRIQFAASHLNGRYKKYYNFINAIEDTKKLTNFKASQDFVHTYAMAKYFFGNSFNIGAGLGQRKTILNYSFSPVQGTPTAVTESGEIISTSSTFFFNIGNTWTLDDGIFVGIDWISIANPLDTQIKSTRSNATDPELSYFHEESVKYVEEHGQKETDEFLTLNLGISF